MKKNDCIHNKSGEVSYYGLRCGYIECKETTTRYKQLFMEHDHFHVISGPIDQKFDKWEVFERSELTKARKLYRSL